MSGIGVTNAFFSDTETSSGNVLQAGEFDLEIDNESYYNGELFAETTWELANLNDGLGPSGQGQYLFFNFTDLKPDDEGEDTISLHVQNNAWACMNIAKTEDDDESCTTPELTDDPTCVDDEPNVDLASGELGSLLNFVFWADDGDNVLETEEMVIKEGVASTLFDGAIWTLADSITNIWNGTGPMIGGDTYYVGKAWCFGTLTKAPLTQDGVNNLLTPANSTGGISCEGTALNNASQTDKLMADIEFSAYQARNNNDFVCGGPSLTPTPTLVPTLSPTPTPIACVAGFATGVVSSSQGTRKNGTAVLFDRTDPTDALGAPQSTGTPSDSPVVAGSFFSLGFGPTNTPGGNIVLSFADPIVNMAGFDFRVFEVTGGIYPDEKIMVEASQDGSTWHTVTTSGIRDIFLDLGVTPLAWASHLRITDVSDKSLAAFPSDADGYDLDGVQTFCGTQPLP